MPIDVDYDKARHTISNISSELLLLLLLDLRVVLCIQEYLLLLLLSYLIFIVLIIKADCQKVAFVAKFYGNDPSSRYLW